MKEIWLVSIVHPNDRYTEVGYIEGVEEDVISYCEKHSGFLAEDEEYCYMTLANLLEE